MVDVELKRRYDLIPQLVDCVKSYANYEKATLTGIVQARNLASSATKLVDKESADLKLTQQLKQFFCVG